MKTFPPFGNELLPPSKNISLTDCPIMYPLKQKYLCYYDPRCIMSSGLMFYEIIVDIISNKKFHLITSAKTLNTVKSLVQQKLSWPVSNCEQCPAMNKHHIAPENYFLTRRGERTSTTLVGCTKRTGHPDNHWADSRKFSRLGLACTTFVSIIISHVQWHRVFKQESGCSMCCCWLWLLAKKGIDHFNHEHIKMWFQRWFENQCQCPLVTLSCQNNDQQVRIGGVVEIKEEQEATGKKTKVWLRNQPTIQIWMVLNLQGRGGTAWTKN